MSRYAEIGFALDRITAKEIPEHGMDFEDYADNAPGGSEARGGSVDNESMSQLLCFVHLL